MRHYQITVEGNEYEIDVQELSATQFSVEIDGQAVDVTLNSQEDVGVAAITPDQSQATAVAGQSAATQQRSPKVPAEMRSMKTRTPSPAVTGGADLAYSMTAPMPGVILSINVSPGDQVNEGDVLMVLEAMKMNNDLHASRSGTIASVDVAAGDQVKYGQVLLRFAKD